MASWLFCSQELSVLLLASRRTSYSSSAGSVSAYTFFTAKFQHHTQNIQTAITRFALNGCRPIIAKLAFSKPKDFANLC